ncbi:MAG: AI-2E family transporter [Ilumatobacter sp.]|nr:MAG: AI-2E family transporter [Ilumatobacter sp.]
MADNEDRPDPQPPEGEPTMRAAGRRIDQHRLTRAGIFAWSLLGLFGTLVVFVYLLDMFKLVVIPLVIALFPAALLSPLSSRLKRWGFPPLAAAAVVVVGFLVMFLGLLAALIWLIVGELDDLLETLEQAYADVANWIDDVIGWTPPSLDELFERIQNWAMELEVGNTASTVAFTTFEVIAGVLFGVIALLFYLKDGERMTGVVLQLTPARLRDDVAEVFRRVWDTLGGYFRGQILVALVDAVAIGIGLFLLGVPLALPLAMLVFFGGLFPIVGAFTAGAVAVLVALADGGIGLALAVLVLNVAVQQLEGNLLEPLIVGRATHLHPLLVLASLTAGAVTLGILGAFLAVPITAAIVRAVTYVLERDPELAIEYHAELPRLEDHVPDPDD